MFLLSKFRYKLIGYALLTLLLFLIFQESIGVLLMFVSESFIKPHAQESLLNDLKIENMILSLKVEELDDLAQENEKLKKTLQLKEIHNITVIYGKIWGFSPSAWRRVAFCGAGRKQNVQKDNLVITEDKLLIGKINEVFDQYSTILLVNDPYFSLPVFIEAKGMGLLQGSLSGSPQILYVKEDQNITVGDTVFTSAQSLPFQLKVGVVNRVTQDENDFFIKVEATPQVSIPSLRDVFIIQ